jgi:hypothetical protein
MIAHIMTRKTAPRLPEYEQYKWPTKSETNRVVDIRSVQATTIDLYILQFIYGVLAIWFTTYRHQEDHSRE